MAVGLGTLFFGLAHLTVAWFNGLNPAKAPLVAPMGLVAGLGLSLALYGQPRVGLRLRIRSWLLRLTTAALTFIGITAGLVLAGAWLAWWRRLVNQADE